MRDLAGKTAFITGGASGIGLAMAEAFGRAGMNIVIADIEAAALPAALRRLHMAGAQAVGVETDVTSRASLIEAARLTTETFGSVHLVCNNAGVGVGGPMGHLAPSDWDWIIDVNLKGVIHGMEVFEPLISRHGEGGHFVNTASVAGLIAPPTMEPYTATKYAVIGMSEGWAAQLAPRNIGMSILCPGFVPTQIARSERNRQAIYRETGLPTASTWPAPIEQTSAVPPDAVAARVVEAVRDNELYILTHMEFRNLAALRFRKILAAFDRAARSPALRALSVSTLDERQESRET